MFIVARYTGRCDSICNLLNLPKQFANDVNTETRLRLKTNRVVTAPRRSRRTSWQRSSNFLAHTLDSEFKVVRLVRVVSNAVNFEAQLYALAIGFYLSSRPRPGKRYRNDSIRYLNATLCASCIDSAASPASVSDKMFYGSRWEDFVGNTGVRDDELGYWASFRAAEFRMNWLRGFAEETNR